MGRKYSEHSPRALGWRKGQRGVCNTGDYAWRIFTLTKLRPDGSYDTDIMLNGTPVQMPVSKHNSEWVLRVPEQISEDDERIQQQQFLATLAH